MCQWRLTPGCSMAGVLGVSKLGGFQDGMEGGGRRSSSKEGVVSLLCTRPYCVFLFRSAACSGFGTSSEHPSCLFTDRDFWIWEHLIPKTVQAQHWLGPNEAIVSRKDAVKNKYTVGSDPPVSHQTSLTPSRAFTNKYQKRSACRERSFMSKPANTSGSLPPPVC
jgi:hypothetical protein